MKCNKRYFIRRRVKSRPPAPPGRVRLRAPAAAARTGIVCENMQGLGAKCESCLGKQKYARRLEVK